MLFLFLDITMCWALAAKKKSFNKFDLICCSLFAIVATLIMVQPVAGVVLLIILLNIEWARNYLLFALFFFVSIITRERTRLMQHIVPLLFSCTSSLRPTGELLLFNYPANFIEYMGPFYFSPIKVVTTEATARYFLSWTSVADHYIVTNENLEERLVETCRRGINVAAYIERCYFERRNIYTIAPQKLRTGLIRMCRKHNITVRPVCITHDMHAKIFVGEALDHTQGEPFLRRFWTKFLTEV